MLYNPSGTYGAGAMPEVIITVVPGLSVNVGTVITWALNVIWSMCLIVLSSVDCSIYELVLVDVNSSYGVCVSARDATASVIISLLQTQIAAMWFDRKATVLALMLMMAPFSLRKSIPKINSEDNLSEMCMLIALSFTGYGKFSLTSMEPPIPSDNSLTRHESHKTQ